MVPRMVCAAQHVELDAKKVIIVTFGPRVFPGGTERRTYVFALQLGFPGHTMAGTKACGPAPHTTVYARMGVEDASP